MIIPQHIVFFFEKVLTNILKVPYIAIQSTKHNKTVMIFSVLHNDLDIKTPYQEFILQKNPSWYEK